MSKNKNFITDNPKKDEEEEKIECSETEKRGLQIKNVYVFPCTIKVGAPVNNVR